MSFASFRVAIIAALVSTVAGHGYVTNVTVADVTWSGYMPYSDPYYNPVPDRIIRPVQGNGPIDDLNIIDLQCGGYSAGGIVGSSPAKLHAGPVAAGSEVSLDWTLWPTSHVGPVITYMAKCPDTNCSSYLPGTDPVWFKVAEGGRDGTSNTWASTALMTAPSTYKYTIPSCLADGYYIVRHEIIALHTAGEYPGAQSFPSCHQLTVTSSGGTSTGPADSVPSGSGTTTAVKVAFPGAYNASDPGITYDITKATTYIIPGPVIFSCDGDSSSSGGSSSPSTPATPSASTSVAVSSSAAASAAAPSRAIAIAAAANVPGLASDAAPSVTPTTLQSVTRSATSTYVPISSPTSSIAATPNEIPSGTTLSDLIAWLETMLASGATTKRSR